MLPNLSISIQSLYITEHNSVTTGGKLSRTTCKEARNRWGRDWWRVNKNEYLAVLAREGYDIRNQKTEAPSIVNPNPPKKSRVVYDDDTSCDDATSPEEEAARAEAEAKAKVEAAAAASAKAKAAAEAARAEAEAKAKVEAAAAASAKAKAAAEAARAEAEAAALALASAVAEAEAKAKAEAAALALAEAAAAAEAEAEAEAKALLLKKPKSRVVQDDNTSEEEEEEDDRPSPQQEAARALALAEAEAKAEADAKAAAEAEANNSPGGSTTEFELTDEPVQNTVSINEAWAAFQTAWRAQNVGAINNIVKDMTDEQADMLFPRMNDVEDIINAGKELQGPIKVCIHRRVKMSTTSGQLKHMPFCGDLLGKQEHFYLHEPDALFAGANEFSALFKNSQKPEAWSVSPKNLTKGYTSCASMASFLRWKTTGVWFYACTFVTHNPTSKSPEDCDLARVIANWTLSYRWLKAAETANAALSAGRGTTPTIQKMNGPRNLEVGVIGYDTPLEVPAWARTLFPKRDNWSDSNFPKLLEDGSIRFGRGGQLCTTAENVLALCVNALPEVFGSVATTQYRSSNASAFDDFVTSSIKVVGLAAWGNHARIIFKNIDTKVIEVFDPWKQEVRVPEYLHSVAIKHGYTMSFVQRGVDQAPGEGSCQFQATMRVLMVGVFGKGVIDQKISADLENRKLLIFPVITQLLYSKFRPKRR